ncbi:MAG: phosphoribosylamine--glycine ligase [Clostridiales Family XIII bacterium]|jgi:phosphoribosylamine--glycine ligase|nr:phosphoribosylamine--glycine ligase [Clostridiales Family XIII bacterium]
MKVLIVGGGGREHAIAWKLRQSPKLTELYCAPGNAGIASVAECVNIEAEDVDGITAFAAEKGMDLVVIGPEVPLAMGLTDMLQAKGVRVFGPNKSCARLEASKSFTKAFLERHHIPTARCKEFYDKEDLLEHIGQFGFPMVLKADGLAAGKGVVIAMNAAEAEKAIEDMMGKRVFGAAADTVLVEEYLEGVEASMLCFVDGSTITPMESAQDYKRILDGDQGPNTGGMGSYSPSLIFSEELEDQIRERILAPVYEGFKADGLDFRGVLFVGLMITEEGPKVIEFNNRFGDPETQVVLPRLKNDLLEIFMAVTRDRLAEHTLRWSSESAVCVVLASGGYPGIYEKGRVISGLDDVDEDILVFHAGTRFESARDSGVGAEVEFVRAANGGETDSTATNGAAGTTAGVSCAPPVVTAGGRVLGVTALGATQAEAREKAYKNAEKIHFEGAHFRYDIGRLNRPAES